MKRILLVLVLIALLAAPVSVHAKPGKKDCTRIQDGVMTYSPGHYLEGQPLSTGYDAFGYNYQAHMFNGLYPNIYLGADGYPPYTGDEAAYLAENPGAASTWYWPYRRLNVVMKWNDAWISNMSCDGDLGLDRHYGFPSYIGSGAWQTLHMRGSYESGGQWCDLNYNNKIVAVPADATLSAGYWYAADGTEIGPEIWGAFATIHEVANDPCYGAHGAQYVSPDHSGLGGW